MEIQDETEVPFPDFRNPLHADFYQLKVGKSVAYSIDGMTEDEVRSRWGKIRAAASYCGKKSPLMKGRRFVAKKVRKQSGDGEEIRVWRKE